MEKQFWFRVEFSGVGTEDWYNYSAESYDSISRARILMQEAARIHDGVWKFRIVKVEQTETAVDWS